MFKKDIKAVDPIIVAPKNSKTPVNYRAMLVEDGEFKDWVDAPKSLKPKAGQQVFYVTKQAFTLRFAPQQANAPTLGVTAKVKFELSGENTDYRLAPFLEGRDNNLTQQELALLIETVLMETETFFQASLMPQMSDEEWQRAQIELSLALQNYMGLSCIELSACVLEDRETLQDVLALARYQGVFDHDHNLGEAPQEATMTHSQLASNEKQQRDKLALAIQLGSWVAGKSWSENLATIDEDLQSKLQQRLERSVKHIQRYRRKNKHLSDSDWKALSGMARRLATQQKNSYALPPLNPKIKSLKRSKEEQRQMLNTMKTLMASSQKLHSLIQVNCLPNTAISPEALQQLTQAEQALIEAMQQRRTV